MHMLSTAARTIASAAIIATLTTAIPVEAAAFDAAGTHAGAFSAGGFHGGLSAGGLHGSPELGSLHGAGLGDRGMAGADQLRAGEFERRDAGHGDWHHDDRWRNDASVGILPGYFGDDPYANAYYYYCDPSSPYYDLDLCDTYGN